MTKQIVRGQFLGMARLYDERGMASLRVLTDVSGEQYGLAFERR